MLPTRKVHALISKLNLNAQKITPLGHGDDSDVFLVDGLYVVKIPKRTEVRASQAREFMLYDYLTSFHFDFQIPKTVFKSDDINAMSYIKGEHISYKQYQKLTEKEKDRLAYDEAKFLKQLHSVKMDYANPLFTEKQDKQQDFINDRELVISILNEKKLLTTQLKDLLDKFYEELLSKAYLYDYSFCITHNDFSSANMIFRSNRLAGVVDFGDFAVGDPDNDFLCLLDNSADDFGKEFGRKVLKYYGHRTPEIAEQKAELNDLYYPYQQIIYGYKRNDEKLFRKGLRGLKACKAEKFKD